jgi:UrcA family protein
MPDQQQCFAPPEQEKSMMPRLTDVLVSAVALSLLSAGALPASAASLSRSVDVEATPSAVWLMIGPFCAIKDWLPPVGACTQDGKVPPTRTLVTKDGKATFVEMQTARSDTEHFYTYTFLSSPLPLTQYTSTIKVAAKGKSTSTVTWSSTYVPEHGKEQDANDALSGIYEAGLDAIKARLTPIAGAAAGDARGTTKQQLVRFAELNVSTPAGASALYGRLQAAARRVCSDLDEQRLPQPQRYRACVAQTTANAVAAVDQPSLTKVHLAQPSRASRIKPRIAMN